MAKDPNARPGLVDAVEAFDAELKKFTHAAEASRRRPLDSRKNIERVAESLKEATDAEVALQARAQDLLAALNAARDRQQAEAEAVHARAQELQKRVALYESFTERYRRLGSEMAALGERAQNLGTVKRPEGTARVDADTNAALTELDQKLNEAREAARSLRVDAQSSEFEDMAKEAHAAEQAIGAIRNKVMLLERALGVTRPEA